MIDSTITATAPTTSPDAAATQPQRTFDAPAAPTKGNWWWGTGRRKTAVARVRIRPGEGKFTVNDKDMAVFFTEERDRNDINNVLEKTNTKGRVDVVVNAHGGGFTGQAGAIILGLGRALKRFDPTLEPILRDNHFLTRDSRKVERKKYGQAGARRRFQFSKR
jgi:small subunit ribosomal protein S9